MDAAPLFPSVLKGVDLSFYEVLLALGLKVSLRQVLQVGGGEDWGDESSTGDDPADQDADPMAALITTSCVSQYSTGTTVTEAGGNEYDSWEDVRRGFGGSLDVFWLNHSLFSTGQEGFIHLTYGNEPGVNTLYTYMAIIFQVKKWEDNERAK